MRKVDIGKYWLTDDGRLFNKTSGTEFIPSTTKDGYKQISYNGKTTPLHRLVAIFFVPNPENLTDVDHINDIRSDNRFENLQWLSHSENVKKRIKERNKVNNTTWAERNKERVKANNKAWYERNKERARNNSKHWHEANKEYVKIRKRIYRANKNKKPSDKLCDGLVES